VTDFAMADTEIYLNRILCPVGFSTSSTEVIRCTAARGIERHRGGLFHALDRDPRTAESLDPVHRDERALDKLFRLAKELPGRTRFSAAVTERTTDRRNPPSWAHAASRPDCDWCKDRRGQCGPARVQGRDRGAVSRSGHSDVPVGRPPPGERLIRSLLCAVNFMPASLAAADHAFALAQRTAASVTVVHVVPERRDRSDRADGLGNALELVERHFRQLLHMAVRDASASNVDTSELVVSGTPCVEIVRLAHMCRRPSRNGHRAETAIRSGFWQHRGMRDRVYAVSRSTYTGSTVSHTAQSSTKRFTRGVKQRVFARTTGLGSVHRRFLRQSS
jgi:nucleotide-binding universal stress UspA family protein